MFDLDQVLVIDGSQIARQLLARLMKRHSVSTHAFDDCGKARDWIAGHSGVSLVIADVEAPGGGGMSILELVAELDPPRPRVLLTARRFEDSERIQAEHLGAIGCLIKPLSFQGIAEALAASQRDLVHSVAPRRYSVPVALAHVIDPASPHSQIVWNVHDLSPTGALLDTRGPIPVGTSLSLALWIGDQRLAVECEVVRLQEPAWDTLPGVAVRFVDLSEAQRAVLENELA